jgi:hypothetical protein
MASRLDRYQVSNRKPGDRFLKRTSTVCRTVKALRVDGVAARRPDAPVLIAPNKAAIDKLDRTRRNTSRVIECVAR